MKNIKLRNLILLPVLAAAFVACTVFGLVGLNNTKTATTVSADETRRVFFYNTGVPNGENFDLKWTDGKVEVNIWGSANGSNNGYFLMNRVGYTDWYYYDIAVDCTNLQFHAQGWANNAYSTTVSLTYNTGNFYYITGWAGHDEQRSVAGLTVENLTTDGSTVTIPTKTAYFINDTDWGAVYAHCFRSDNTQITTVWPGIQMSNVSGNLYSVGVPEIYNRIIFDNNYGSQTGSMEIDIDSTPYFRLKANDSNRSGWYTSDQYRMLASGGWYLIGKLNGTENWTSSPDTYMVSDDESGSGNHAVWIAALKKGDKVKAIHGNDILDNTMLKSADVAVDGVYTIDGDGNAVVTYDGTYTVYLSSTSEHISLVRVGAVSTLDIQTTKHKTSDNKDYLLLITGFDATVANAIYNDGEKEVKAGYLINGVEYDTYDVFSGVVLSLTDGTFKRYSANDLYSLSEDTYKLIVRELSCESGDTFTVQAYIKVDGVVVATGSTISGTISSKAA